MATKMNEPEEALRRPAVPMEPIIDPAEWRGTDLEADHSWEFWLTDAELAEIDTAIQDVTTRGLDIKDITADDFPLPILEPKLAAMKRQLTDGFGLAVLRGLPVERYSIAESAAAYWGIGLRMGVPVPQNYKRHILGHVVDLGGLSRDKDPSIRGYNTSGPLSYHSDSCDVVGLLCLKKAKEGGLSKLASTVAIYNEMLRRRPDIVEELVKPWYRDRRNEIPPGKKPYFELPVFHFAEGYFSCGWQNFYIRSAQRFEELPRFTERQQEALDMIDALSEELRFDQTFEPGDMQFLHNHVIVHSRTSYDDYPEPDRRRHLLRLWLATPGGRPLTDAILDRYVGLKPGQRPAGIVVEGMELCTPLVPE